MKVTIEEINGVTHTIVWRNENIDITDRFSELYLGLDNEYEGDMLFDISSGVHIGAEQNTGEVEWIALSPLPRNPTADDAKLLHLYAALGLEICGYYFCALADDHNKLNKTKEIISIITCEALDLTTTVITHAINDAGERVKIAIIDREGN